jgi:hypothetical protein
MSLNGHVFYKEINKFDIPSFLRSAADETVEACCYDLKLPAIRVRWMLEIILEEYIRLLRETDIFVIDHQGMDGFHISYTEDEPDIFVIYRKGETTAQRTRHVVRHECRHAWQTFYFPPYSHSREWNEEDAENYAFSFE